MISKLSRSYSIVIIMAKRGITVDILVPQNSLDRLDLNAATMTTLRALQLLVGGAQ